MNSRLNICLLACGVAVCSWALARYTAQPDQNSARAGFSMELIPHPNLDRLGAKSRAQIDAARAQCQLLLSHPKSTDPLLRARAVAELGKHYHAYNFFDAAAACFQFAQQWQPTEFRWPYLLGQAHRRNGQMDAAAKSIERALAIAPLDMSVSKGQGVAMLTWLGEIYLGANQLDRAERCLQRALEEDSESGMALMKLGQIAAARGDHKQAIAFLERVLKTPPASRNLLLLLAAEYRKNGETARAEQTLEQAEARGVPKTILHPVDPVLAEVQQLDKSFQRYNSMGNTALAAGRLEQARQLYETGLEIAPNEEALLGNMGTVWDRLGDYQRAREFWLRLLEAGPNENALSLLGQSHFRAGDHDQALAYLQQALDMKPNDARYRFMLASVHSHAGRFDEALRAFGDVLAADPAHTGASLGEIRMLAALGRDDEALQRAERCRSELPDFPGATLAVARLLAACPDDELRDGKRALELARGVYDAKKTVVAAETLAMAYAETGDFEQAIETQNWAIEQLAPTRLEAAKERLRKRLEMYENKQVCRQPWTPDNPYPAITRPLDLAGASEEVLDEGAGKTELEVTPIENTP